MEQRKPMDKNLAVVMPIEDPNSSFAGTTQKMEFKEYIFDRWEKNHYCSKLNADCHLKQLESENCRLKMLIEDLSQDKLIQAQRIKELELEKSQLKNIVAELSLGQQMLKKAF